MRSVILLGFIALSNIAIAQGASQAVADGTVHTQVDGITIPSIPNAPFTARVVVTWDQPLVGGGTVSAIPRAACIARSVTSFPPNPPQILPCAASASQIPSAPHTLPARRTP